MRDLPAVLEEVAGEWESGALALSDAVKRFGKDVLLCHRSRELWQDEVVPPDDTYWRLFNRLAEAVERYVRAEARR